MQHAHAKVTVGANDGELVMFGGIGAQFKITGEQTGGAFSIVEQPVEPGAMVPPHVHTREDEFSFVLEGELGAKIGDQEIHATPGTWIIKPRGIPHTFWNPGTKTARFIEIISPAGLEQLFRELGALFAQGRPEVEKLEQLAQKYECPLTNMEWVPELVERYNLKLL